MRRSSRACSPPVVARLKGGAGNHKTYKIFMRFETPPGKLKEQIAGIEAIYCPARFGARFGTEKVKMPRRPR